MIDGRLDNHLLVLLHKDVDGHADALHDARDIGEPFALHLPLVMVVNPLDDAGPQLIGHHCIAKERMLQALTQGVRDKLRRFKVHVGHPQGQQVITSITLLEYPMLQVATARTINNLIEVVCHARACLMSARISPLSSSPMDRRMVV